MIEKNKRVAILLSSYNGEKYIKEQIDSLLAQDFGGRIHIHIRDDGSKDKTMDILNEYKNKHNDTFFIYGGENVGPIHSFLNLLELVHDYDYYAFCDQDDFWMPNKVSIACDYLESSNVEPNLYCSSLNIVDEKLSFIRKSMCYKLLELENVLVESFVAGCTMVFNAALREEVLETLPYVRKYKILMHDSWVLKVALMTGQAYFDNDSYILYRQHDANVVGASTNISSLIKRKLKNMMRSYTEYSIVDEAVLLELIYGRLTDTRKLHLIKSVIKLDSSFSQRAKELMKGNLYRNRYADKVLFYMMVIVGLYKKHLKL